MATASFQILSFDAHGDTAVGPLRVHPDGGDWREGSKFTWAATLLLNPPRAEIWGAMRLPKGKERKAIKEFLAEKNVNELHYEFKGRWIVRRRK